MYIVTGGAGFIGSAFVHKLNEQNIRDILIVDNLGKSEKWKNLVGLEYSDYIHKDDFLQMVMDDALGRGIKAIVHMGACSSTVETDMDYLLANNYRYSIALADYALRHKIRFVYASSAATYGDGAQGYLDSHDGISSLRPLNRYGYSKQLFDLWALKNNHLDKMVGVKFFNVYGPNEYHKGEMRSVVHKAFTQIKEIGKVRLFKSYQPEYADGEQQRDFLYVRDAVELLWWYLQNPQVNGIFNAGSGEARTWNALARAIFAAMNQAPQIEYIEMADTLKKQYQYYTRADMKKVSACGFGRTFYSLEDGIRDYVKNYLARDSLYLTPSSERSLA